MFFINLQLYMNKVVRHFLSFFYKFHSIITIIYIEFLIFFLFIFNYLIIFVFELTY